MDKLKEMLRELRFSENSKKIEIQAYSLEKAISEGCRKLNASIDEIEYEIISYGNTGFLGLNKKPYKILIYKIAKIIETKEEILPSAIEDVQEILDPDGKFFVVISFHGVLLRILPPKTKEGKKIKYKEVIDYLKVKNINEFNEKIIRAVCDKSSGEYVKIGDYKGMPEASATLQIKLTPDEMTATVIAFPPKAKGYEVDIDMIKSQLEENGIVEGYNMDEMHRLVDEKIYYQDIVVAKGKKPVNGENAKFKYHFDLVADDNLYKGIIEKGKFDFKLINKNVQNVLKNDLLVEKIPYSEGENGYTVTGKLITAKPGQDKSIPAGENTVLSQDGIQLRASIDGQVIKKKNRICVEPVKHIQGDVDIKVGNIVFVGSVVVHGSIQDGFSIKAKGTIEIRGSVGKCSLISDSDIYIAQGIAGKNEAEIITEGSVFAKFIESANVYAGKSVIVDDHIGHSQIDANEYIICFGRRAQIYGGTLRCGVEINAKNLGNVSYSETVFEVGILPELRRDWEKYLDEKTKMQEEIDKLKLDINTLEDQRRSKSKWNQEKQNLYHERVERLKEIEEMLKNADESIKELQQQIAEMDIGGKVCFKTICYVNVRIRTKNAEYEVEQELRSGTFYEKENEVMIGPYEVPSVDRRLYDKRMLSLRGKL